MRQEEHERQPPYERPRPKQPPLPDPSTWAVSEEFLDEQGLEPIELEGEALVAYLVQLEEAVWMWWKTTGLATNLPSHHGRQVDPEGPKTGECWPSDNFVTAQVRTLWALERAARTFAEGMDVSEPARVWLIGQRASHFTNLHESSQRAPDGKGRCMRYVSLDKPVDPTPKPSEQGIHLSQEDDLAIVSELPHLQPEEMREMELVLRAYWQAAAREANGQERFQGPPPEFLQALGFQAEEMAGRIARWKRIQGNEGRPRGIVIGAIYNRDQWWTEAFTDLNLETPKPHTELVTRQGNRVYVVDPQASPLRAYAGGWRPAVGQHRGRATTHLHQGAVAVDETAEDQPAGYITIRGGNNGARRRWSRRVGGRNGPSNEPHPHRGSRAGDCLPSARRVAAPSHSAIDDGALKLGRNAQRRCPTSGAAAGRPHSCGGTAPGITTAHPVDSSRLARQRALPTGVVCRSAGGVRIRGGHSHTVVVPGRARCQSNAGKDAEPAPSPHQNPIE
jgi:hypothetical protein